jgi:F0F1-type ATP synthase membrane subunit b/b'
MERCHLLDQHATERREQAKKEAEEIRASAADEAEEVLASARATARETLARAHNEAAEIIFAARLRIPSTVGPPWRSTSSTRPGQTSKASSPT